MQFNIIYKTTNSINGKIYVGKHVQHNTSAFDDYLGSGRIIKFAIEKYGKENFLRETLEMTETEQLSYEREKYWIAELDSQNPLIGYNIHPGGEGASSEFMIEKWKDLIFREYTIDQMLIAQQRPEVKENKSRIAKERFNDEVRRESWILACIEAQNKPEQKEKVSQASKENWKRPEYREKTTKNIKEALNRPEIKEKRSKALKISQNRPEVKAKISKASKGHKYNIRFHYILKDPNGKIWETNDLNNFCKEHGLSQSCMSAICLGQYKQHKGWTCISKSLIKKKEQEEKI